MRFILYPLLLCLGLTASAHRPPTKQFHVELGANGGPTLAYVMNEKATSTITRPGGRVGVNFHFNFQHKSPLYFSLAFGSGVTNFTAYENYSRPDINPAFGPRGGMSYGYMNITPAIYYQQQISRNIQWRVGTGVSGLFETFGIIDNPQFNIAPELHSDVILGQVVSLGINYVKPIWGYTSYDSHASPYFGNTYGIHALTFDVRLNITELGRREEARDR